MSSISILAGRTGALEAYRGNTFTVEGQALCRRDDRADFSLWRLAGVFRNGDRLLWGTNHLTEVFYVERGSVILDGTECGPGTAVIIEAGIAASLTCQEDAETIHFGQSAPLGGGEARTPGRGVHVVGPGPKSVFVTNAGGSPMTASYYLDSTCESCEVGLLRVWSPGPFRVRSHSHSEDEIIHMVRGSLRIGRDTVSAGQAVAIPGSRVYGFTADEPFEYINYRAGGSFISTHGNPDQEENAASQGFFSVATRDLYVRPAS